MLGTATDVRIKVNPPLPVIRTERPVRVSPSRSIEPIPDIDLNPLLSTLDHSCMSRPDGYSVSGIKIDDIDDRSQFRQLFECENKKPNIFSDTIVEQPTYAVMPSSFKDAFQYIGCPLSISVETLKSENREDLKFILRHVPFIMDVIDSHIKVKYAHGMRFHHAVGYRNLIVYPIIKEDEVVECKISTLKEYKSLTSPLPRHYIGRDEIINRYKK